MIDAATGEVLNSYNTEEEPNHRLLVACRNRRASRCAPCAEQYRADTYQLIRAGLAGGKNVPNTVAGHPRIFATLTAPSFGAVHHRVVNPDRSVQRCHPGAGCNRRHDADEPCLGQAVTLTATTTAAPSSGTPWPASSGIARPPCSSVIWPDFSVYRKEFRRQCRRLLRQGGGVSDSGPGPLPRHHPLGRPRRTGRAAS